jgi:hypothetical protein
MKDPDFLRLLEYSLNLAKTQLAKEGDYVPFAATIAQGGILEPLVTAEDLETPTPEARIASYLEAWPKLARDGRASAVAICFDSGFSPDQSPRPAVDEITVILDHVEGESVTVYLPYRFRSFLGIKFGKTRAAWRQSAVAVHRPA